MSTSTSTIIPLLSDVIISTHILPCLYGGDVAKIIRACDYEALLLFRGDCSSLTSKGISTTVRFKDERFFNWLLVNGYINTYMTDVTDVAIMAGKMHIVKKLLDSNIRFSKQCITIAMEYNQCSIAKYLCERLDIDVHSLLSAAGKSGDPDIVKRLMQTHELDSITSLYCVLSGAAAKGQFKTLDILYETYPEECKHCIYAYADILDGAILFNRLDVIEYIVDHWADVKLNRKLISTAIGYDRYSIVKYLHDERGIPYTLSSIASAESNYNLELVRYLYDNWRPEYDLQPQSFDEFKNRRSCSFTDRMLNTLERMFMSDPAFYDVVYRARGREYMMAISKYAIRNGFDSLAAIIDRQDV